jgi:hypothetical protein
VRESCIIMLADSVDGHEMSDYKRGVCSVLIDR